MSEKYTHIKTALNTELSSTNSVIINR